MGSLERGINVIPQAPDEVQASVKVEQGVEFNPAIYELGRVIYEDPGFYAEVQQLALTRATRLIFPENGQAQKYSEVPYVRTTIPKRLPADLAQVAPP